jgi:hypothetical protein
MSFVPNFRKLPKDIKFVAVDGDGTAFGYPSRPILPAPSSFVWYRGRGTDRVEFIQHVHPIPDDWRVKIWER